MAESDGERWDEKHARRAADGTGAVPAPSPRLLAALERADRPGPGATALDLACGRGRHALLLARARLEVLAVDVSGVALSLLREAADRQGLRVRTERRDLALDGLPPGRFDLVAVTDFLDRGLFPALAEAVQPGGWLFFETFSWRQAEATGFRRAYCLEEGELLAALPAFEVLSHEEGELEGSFRESLLARRPPDESR